MRLTSNYSTVMYKKCSTSTPTTQIFRLKIKSRLLKPTVANFYLNDFSNHMKILDYAETYLTETRGALVAIVHWHQLTTVVLLIQMATSSQRQCTTTIAPSGPRRLTRIVFTSCTAVTRGTNRIEAVGRQWWTLTPAVYFTILQRKNECNN